MSNVPPQGVGAPGVPLPDPADAAVPIAQPPAVQAAPEWRGWKVIRWIMAVASLSVVGAEIGYLAWETTPTIRRFERGEVDLGDLEYDTVTKFAVDLRTDQAKSMLTYVVVMLGALWSLLLVKPDSPGIGGRDPQEILMFLAANVAVFVHVWLYSRYMGFVSGLAAAASRSRNPGDSPSIPDIFDARINLFASLQQYSAAAVLVLVALVLISVHKVKGKKA